MDINTLKLKRIVSHIENDGVVSPESIAKILKAQAKNTGYLRSYVEAACKEIGDTAALAEFESNVGQAEEAPTTAPEQPAPETAIPVLAEQASAPAPEVQRPRRQVAKEPVAESNLKYGLLDETGTLQILEVVKQIGNNIVFKVAKEKKEVKVILRGQEVVVDLLDLQPVMVGAITFSVDELRPIANAAAL